MARLLLLDRRGAEHAENSTKRDNLLRRNWSNQRGARLGLAKLAIDASYEPTAVNFGTSRIGYVQTAPIKCVESFNRDAASISPALISRPTPSDGTSRKRRTLRNHLSPPSSSSVLTDNTNIAGVKLR